MLLVLLLFLPKTVSAAGVINHYFASLKVAVLCSLSVFLYPSTSNSVVALCDGANVTTLTCVTDTGTLIWSTAAGHKTFKSGFTGNSSFALKDYFIVRLTNEINMTLTSDLTIVAPPPSLHKSVILCGDDGYPVPTSIEKTLLISCILKHCLVVQK